MIRAERTSHARVNQQCRVPCHISPWLICTVYYGRKTTEIPQYFDQILNFGSSCSHAFDDQDWIQYAKVAQHILFHDKFHLDRIIVSLLGWNPKFDHVYFTILWWILPVNKIQEIIEKAIAIKAQANHPSAVGKRKINERNWADPYDSKARLNGLATGDVCMGEGGIESKKN